jgi:general secretion pathway protein N
LRAAVFLVVVVFVITLLVRLPARVLVSLLPPDVACAAPSGTIWSGSCGQLRAGVVTVSGLSWQLHPAALLHGRIGADVASQDPAANGHAQLELKTNGDVAVAALSANLALPRDSGLVPAGSSGTLQLAIDSARIEGGHLVAVQGTIDLQQLHIENPAADLGSFELRFPPPQQDAAIVGMLHDRSGPLSVIGVLRLSRSGSYELQGNVAARAGASADLTQLLQMLGPPDAQDRRGFSIAGTL